ncbi:MAG: lipoate--protein ligase family protein [Thermoplasmata archaeon]
MNKLRVVLFETPHDPYYSMAYEEAFTRVRSKDLTEDTLRIFRHRDSVIIGYFQYAEDEVNLEAAKNMNIMVTRRFTGGGAVFHDLGDINYAFAFKGKIGTVDSIYRIYVKGILKSLNYLGVNADVQNVNDIVVGNHKISGTAASMRWNTSFIHGAMLVKTDLNKLAGVLKVSKKKLEDKNISDVKYRVMNLSDILKREVDYSEIIHSLVKGFSDFLEREYYFDGPTKEELDVADLLYREKYSKNEWNLKRAPFSYFSSVEEKISEILEK